MTTNDVGDNGICVQFLVNVGSLSIVEEICTVIRAGVNGRSTFIAKLYSREQNYNFAIPSLVDVQVARFHRNDLGWIGERERERERERESDRQRKE